MPQTGPGRRRTVWLASAVILIGAPTGAQAAAGLMSKEGSDYSVDWNLIRQVDACDMESDGHGVHADYLVIGSGTNQQVRDGNGANNGGESSGVYSAKIYRHRIVEEIPFDNDQFGPWVYPS